LAVNSFVVWLKSAISPVLLSAVPVPV